MNKTPNKAMNKKNIHYSFIGAGNMAKGIISGMINNGIDANHILTSTRTVESGQQLIQSFGVKNTQNNNDCLAADVIVLAVKPQILSEVLAQFDKKALSEKLIISVIAGIPSTVYQKHIGESIRFVRTMPNMPSAIGLGMTGLFATNCSDTDKQTAEQLLNFVGKTLWVEKETAIDYVNAISGSGPAYFYGFIHHLAQSGEKLGLTYEDALQLAVQTAIGSSQLAEKCNDGTPESMQRLINQITSKGGTTFMAMQSFEKSGLSQVIDAAVDDCYQRAIELGLQYQ